MDYKFNMESIHEDVALLRKQGYTLYKASQDALQSGNLEKYHTLRTYSTMRMGFICAQVGKPRGLVRW